MEFGCREVDDGDHFVFVAVASGAGFGGLDEGVDALNHSYGQWLEVVRIATPCRRDIAAAKCRISCDVLGTVVSTVMA